MRDAIAAGRLAADGKHPARERLGGRDQGRDRAGLVAARRRAALRLSARPTCAARCSRRPAACTPSSSRAATSRCSCRRSAARPLYVFGDPQRPRRPDGHADRARPRRVQRLGRVRLRHLHLPAVPHARDRGVHPRRAGGRRRADRLLPQGRPRARRGDQVPRLQRAQAPGGRRLGRRNYFLRTECVAGVQDMRFQELMPDVLHWLGRPTHPSARLDEQHEVRRDRRAAASRSASACRFPTTLVPADARVEMDAKMAAGYFTEGERPDAERLADDQGPRPVTVGGGAPGRRAATLAARWRRRCATIRERCANILAAADAGRSRHFRVDRTQPRRGCAGVVADVTRRRYPTLAIPVPQPLAALRGGRRRPRGGARRARSHGRSAARRARSRASTSRSSACCSMRAPAPRWSYREPGTGAVATRARKGSASRASARSWRARSRRSRGDPLRVDARGAARDRRARRSRACSRSSDDNPLVGLDGRAALLRRLGARWPRERPVGALRAPGVLDALAPRASPAGATRCARLLDAPERDLAARAVRSAASPLGDGWRASARRRARGDAGLRAVPQAVAVARLLAVRAARAGGRARRRAATR